MASNTFTTNLMDTSTGYLDLHLSLPVELSSTFTETHAVIHMWTVNHQSVLIVQVSFFKAYCNGDTCCGQHSENKTTTVNLRRKSSLSPSTLFSPLLRCLHLPMPFTDSSNGILSGKEVYVYKGNNNVVPWSWKGVSFHSNVALTTSKVAHPERKQQLSQLQWVIEVSQNSNTFLITSNTFNVEW